MGSMSTNSRLGKPTYGKHNHKSEVEAAHKQSARAERSSPQGAKTPRDTTVSEDDAYKEEIKTMECCKVRGDNKPLHKVWEEEELGAGEAASPVHYWYQFA